MEASTEGSARQRLRLGPLASRVDGLVGRHGALAFRLGLLAVVGAAAAIRFATIRMQLPYMNYFDEIFPLEGSAHQIAEGTWDPDFYWYGSLVVSLTTVTAYVLTWLGADGLTEGARATLASPYTELVAPPSLILAGRLVVLAFSVATVWLVGLLGARLGGRRVGLLAAALAGVLPMFVQRGSIVITDTVGAFFVVLVVYAATRIADGDRPLRWAVLGGVGSALALTSKYTPGVVALVVVVVVLLRTDLDRRHRVRLVVAAGLAGAVAAIVTMPALALRTGAVIDDIRFVNDTYDRFPATSPYHEQVASSVEIGIPTLLLGAAGLVVLLVRRRTRPVMLGYAAFGLVFLAILIRSDFQPVRNVLPLAPLLCVGAGVAIVEVVRVVGRPLGLGATVRVAATGLLLLAVTVPMLRHEVRPMLAQQKAVDTRVVVRQWLQGHVQPGDDVLVAEELVFLPDELEAIDADVHVISQRRAIEPDAYDYVVLGSFGQQPWAWLLGPNGSVVDGRTLELTVGTVLASCERRAEGDPPQPPNCPPSPSPRAWHDNRLLIRVYAPDDTA